MATCDVASVEQTPDAIGSIDTMSWLLRTETELSSAKSLVREVETQVAQNAITDLDSKYSRTVMGKLKMKLANTNHLTRALQDQIATVEDMMRKLRESDLSLQRSAAMRQAPLCICKRRLELRARRAEQEMVRDEFQIAVEAEEEMLSYVREELSHLLRNTRGLQQELYHVRQALLDDCFEKRRTGRIDHLCLLDSSQRPVLSTADYVMAPTMVEVLNTDQLAPPTNAPPGTGDTEEDKRKELTKALILKAARLVLDGEWRCGENKRSTELFARDCDAASKRTEAALKRSIALLITQRKSLEEQIENTLHSLRAARSSLDKTGRKLRRHENPLQTLSRQFTLRQQRLDRENIRDPVQDKLEAHLDAVKRSVSNLSMRVEGTEDLLQELAATKSQLQEALQAKTQSLRLEQACSRVTLKSVAGHFFNVSPRRSVSRSPSPRSREAKAMQGEARPSLFAEDEPQQRGGSRPTLLSSQGRDDSSIKRQGSQPDFPTSQESKPYPW